MGQISIESGLPHVREDDILTVSVDDVLHPDHRERWEQFAAEQPELARELLVRIGASAMGVSLFETLTKGKASIDLITFVYTALLHARERLERGETEPIGMDVLPFDDTKSLSSTDTPVATQLG